MTHAKCPALAGAVLAMAAEFIHSSTHRTALLERFAEFAARLRWVRITCGDWRRVLTPRDDEPRPDGRIPRSVP